MNAVKDPAATEYFTLDVAAQLDPGETVTSFAPTVANCTLVASSFSGTLLTVWISGGTAGTAASIKYVFETSRTPRKPALTLRVEIGPDVVPSL